MPEKLTAPDPTDLEKGAQYFFSLSPDHHAPGAVHDRPGNVVLTYASRPLGFGKRDVVFRTPDGKEALRVFRSGRFPSRFVMIEKGEPTALITLKSILRNKYRIEFREGPAWTFDMPLFTPLFHGVSEKGARVWTQVGPSKKEWSLLFQPGADSIPLVSALAFIHRQWWRSG